MAQLEQIAKELQEKFGHLAPDDTRQELELAFLQENYPMLDKQAKIHNFVEPVLLFFKETLGKDS